MPPKAKTPAPIDRPLSKAYLREFGGWSTEYPPGISDPSTLRIMENIEISGEGAAKVRPGLALLWPTSTNVTGATLAHLPSNRSMVSKMELFYDDSGEKAYLFAAAERNEAGKVTLVRFYIWSPSARTVEPVSNATFPGAETAGVYFSAATRRVTFLQLDNKIVALSDAGDEAIVFWVGAEKRMKKMRELPTPSGNPTAFQPAGPWITTGQWDGNDPVPRVTLEPPEYLIEEEYDTKASYFKFAYFYTFSHEMGESPPSDVLTVYLNRAQSAWFTKPPNTPENTPPEEDPRRGGHQMIILPGVSGVVDAIWAGATHVNVYCAMWSSQDVAPVEAALVQSIDLAPWDFPNGGTVPSEGKIWAQHTATPLDVSRVHLLPSSATVDNYSTPTSASNGLVAGDRMVLVNDPKRPAEIWWTSNQPGRFLDFTPAFGGGRKTLASGNLLVPSAVHLWQNPQSADTITILCSGEDGQSSAYYMAPAQVASQSDATNIMAFEETTATEGTTSPWGVEVLNNALYHPLDGGLVKSTASNYNINHRGMTDQISGEWKNLTDKRVMDSAQLGNNLYYLVYNPRGKHVETELDIPGGGDLDVDRGHRGNEVWVLNTGSEKGTWSRWVDVEGMHLQTMFVDGELRMVLIRPEGPVYFRDGSGWDVRWERVWGNGPSALMGRSVDWKLETNTQGANRAHDAWAHLQQVQITLGNFLGSMRYGVKGWDVHGREIDISKIYSRGELPPANSTWDFEDQLLIKRDMKEWFFYAESIEEYDGVWADSSNYSQGQINLVQYRYTPVSVNVGYEYGSVETFEYGSAYPSWNDGNTIAGVPKPVNDPRYP